MTLKEQLYATVDQLTPEQQAHLLAVARQLQASPLPPGTSGAALLNALDDFTFAPGEVDTMMTAIRDNEEIDWDGWR